MIYHYTKGYCLKSIFDDGFIATERKRGINKTPHLTDFVWLTTGVRFPKTALPLIPSIPSTSLSLHLFTKSLTMDYEAISQVCAGLYRFGFSENDPRFKRWFRSEERQSMLGNEKWESMERIANKVGDDVRSFWISLSDIPLTKYTLEHLVNGQWNKLIDVTAEVSATPDSSVLTSLRDNSSQWLKRNGFRDNAFKRAA